MPAKSIRAVALALLAVGGAAAAPGDACAGDSAREGGDAEAAAMLQVQSAVDPKTGAWGSGDMKRHADSTCMARKLHRFLSERNATSVADLGTGPATYSTYLASTLFAKSPGAVFCVDGNPNVAEISRGLCKQMDLSVDQAAAMPKSDWAFSLEVAEHIPKQFETTFLDNLDHANRHGVIISWARVGQMGTGHVNCQNSDYVIGTMKARGYHLDWPASLQMRGACPRLVEWTWFMRNPLVFTRSHGAASL